MSDQKSQQSGYPNPGATPPGQGYPPPPPYQANNPQYPQQQYGLPGTQQGGVGGARTVHVVYEARLGEDPVEMTCPNCHKQIRTTVKSEPGLSVWLTCIGLTFIGCFCGCCLIPFCVDSMKVYTHTCPSCKAFLGRYKGAASLG